MKSYRKELTFQTPTRRAFINITPQVRDALMASGIQEGLLLVNLDQTQPVAVGKQLEWGGDIDFNQFDENMVKLRNTDLKDLKIEWVPTKIIYSDGTTIGT